MRSSGWRFGVLVALVAARASAEPGEPPKTEVGFFPVAGGDSDIGFGGGQISSLTRTGRAPYLWRVETGALVTFKPHSVPYQDYYGMLTLPHVVPDRFRLELRPSYTRETNVRYYGLGNASPPGPQSELEYTRAHPTVRLRLETKATPALRVRTGVQYTHQLLEVPDGTRLARDMQSGSPEVKALLGDARDHGVLLFEDTLLLDTRDDETWPTKGQYHQLQFRASPGGSGWFLYRYGQADLTLRAYVTPIPRYLTLAARATADVLVGHPPFYELARYEETNAVGGANGVRGVPANRYYGKVKVFGGVEARSELVSFRLFGEQASFGTALFFDAGRVWADTEPHPELDGTGLGLKYGVGGGLRLRQGKSFVVRADLAWSPDAEPLGFYFAAGNAF